ncbi:MAG: hypothetical protein ACRD04_06090 [Terriglobales bacterium]
MRARSWWNLFWRWIVLCEVVGMIVCGLLSAMSWQALHVTWLALYHHPNLLLSVGTTFISAALAALVLFAGFVVSLPVLAISEWVSSREKLAIARREAAIATVTPIPVRGERVGRS